MPPRPTPATTTAIPAHIQGGMSTLAVTADAGSTPGAVFVSEGPSVSDGIGEDANGCGVTSGVAGGIEATGGGAFGAAATGGAGGGAAGGGGGGAPPPPPAAEPDRIAGFWP